MKILIITQYFWPESFRINDLCLRLIAEGNEVIVLTGKPNYPKGKFQVGYNWYNKNFELWNNIKIYRTPLFPRGNAGGVQLFINYISFAISASFRIFTLKEKFDKIFVYQLSPATIAIPSFIAKNFFKCPLYFYIQDLWPESLVDTGGIKSKFLINIIDNWLLKFYKQVDFIIVQSIGFKDYLHKKGVDFKKISYLPNTVEEFYQPNKFNNDISAMFPTGFNILFAGNLGIAQDFSTIIQASVILENKNIPINWVILGDGRDKENIKNLIKINNLEHRFFFLGMFPTDKMSYFFSCADILLVSLKSSIIFSLTIPSKLQSYMACSKPILGNVDGITFNLINEHKLGLASKSGDYIKLAKNVEKFYFMTEFERKEYAFNSRQFFLKEFDREVVYNKLFKILNNDTF